MPNGSIVLLQACGHNPTGIDLTKEQWSELIMTIKVKIRTLKLLLKI